MCLLGAAGDGRRQSQGPLEIYMAARTTLKLGIRQGRRPTLAGGSSFYPHVASAPLSMPFDQKTPHSPAQITEALPSPFGDELDRSHGAPEKSPPLPGDSHPRRRSTKRTMPAIIKRSASTPNVRGLASTDTAGTSLADKRRNKLGYHRTSVACGELFASAPLARMAVMLIRCKVIEADWRPCRALPKTQDTVFARSG